MKALFDNVDPKSLIQFLKAIQIYNKIWIQIFLTHIYFYIYMLPIKHHLAY